MRDSPSPFLLSLSSSSSLLSHLLQRDFCGSSENQSRSNLIRRHEFPIRQEEDTRMFVFRRVSERRETMLQAVSIHTCSAVNANLHCRSLQPQQLLAFIPPPSHLLNKIYKRLVDLLSFPVHDAQSAAVGALYNLAEVNMDCRLKLASERWAVDRLLKVIKAPHPMPEICRKAAMILENLVSEPQNRTQLLAFENAFAEILFSEGRYSDSFARILYELTSRPSNKVAAARGIWGM